jgi:hypothetical protein
MLDVGLDAADRRAQKRGEIDAADDEFEREYDAATGLIGEIHSLVDSLTYAPGLGSAPAPARDLRRKRNERVIDYDGALKQFPLSSTSATLIAEDLVPADYRVRTS